MEHSYTRDWQPKENTEVMATRTILIDRPPQCPSCHLTPNDEKLEAPEIYSPPIPNYNEEAGRNAMDETERIVRNSSNKNNRSDEEDWETRINKLGWTEQHHSLFRTVARLLDLDQLARLALKDMPNECLRRRALIEKSAARMRDALSLAGKEISLCRYTFIYEKSKPIGFIHRVESKNDPVAARIAVKSPATQLHSFIHRNIAIVTPEDTNVGG